MVERFSPSSLDAGPYRRDRDGAWVRYTDYATIAARVAELEGERDAWFRAAQSALTTGSVVLGSDATISDLQAERGEHKAMREVNARRAQEEYDRATALEAELERLRKMLAGCNWYWPEDDTSSDACHDSPWEIVETYAINRGDVIAVSRGGVVDTRFYASLPAADDADSDDDYDIDEATEDEAKAKIDAEIARRAALANEGE